MKNEYRILMDLTSNLNKSNEIISLVRQYSKSVFSSDEEIINVGIGLVSEVGNFLSSLDDEIFILSKKLFELSEPIKRYSNNLLNPYKFVNSYKLYDCITIDIFNLKTYLNSLE